MSKDPKPIMGYVPCPTPGCEEIASVLKTSGTRTQFYTRCPECGCDQRNGKKHQQWIQDTMKPSADALKAPQPAPEATPKPAPVTVQMPEETRPSRPIAPSTQEEAKPKPRKIAKAATFGFFGMIFGGLIGLAA